jgi:hypothetical protein
MGPASRRPLISPQLYPSLTVTVSLQDSISKEEQQVYSKWLTVVYGCDNWRSPLSPATVLDMLEQLRGEQLILLTPRHCYQTYSWGCSTLFSYSMHVVPILAATFSAYLNLGHDLTSWNGVCPVSLVCKGWS